MIICKWVIKRKMDGITSFNRTTFLLSAFFCVLANVTDRLFTLHKQETAQVEAVIIHYLKIQLFKNAVIKMQLLKIHYLKMQLYLFHM